MGNYELLLECLPGLMDEVQMLSRQVQELMKEIEELKKSEKII